jgi:hypothetical protein
MGLKYFHKTKSSTFAELFADRGHPGPNVVTLIERSAFETFVGSLPRAKNGSNIIRCISYLYISQTKKSEKGFQ